MKFVSFNRIVLFASILLIAAFLYSCQKENSLSNTAVTETEAATLSDESSQAEASFDDADDITFTAAEEEGSASGFGIQGRVTEQGRLYLPGFEELPNNSRATRREVLRH